ncbi:MAG: radical SAM protein [bacterium]
MDCPQSDAADGAEFLRGLSRKAVAQRIPLTGSIELTHRCNLRCGHCYLGGQLRRGELATDPLLRILDEATEAGCLNLLLTGGEPLLRPDFPDIYRRARRNGLVVTVFTNGTLLTEPTLELFAELPPRQVEITLYGATAETYEKVTGASGAFDRCMAGIRGLADRGVRLGLKTVLMTHNRHEFAAMEEIAEELGARFRFDAAIFPRLDGHKGPLRLRVPPQDVVDIEMADPQRLRRWRELFERQRAIPSADTLYHCGAGVTSFHVGPSGRLSPCLMLQEPSCSLMERSFREAWDEVIPRLHEKKVPVGFACASCEKRSLCGYCPAFFAIENGAEDVRSDYLCAIGNLRYQAILEATTGRKQRGRHAVPTQAPEEASLPEAQAAGH